MPPEKQLVDPAMINVICGAAVGAFANVLLALKKRNWRGHLIHIAVDFFGLLIIGIGCGKITLGLGYGSDTATGVAVLTGHYGARWIGTFASKYMGK